MKEEEDPTPSHLIHKKAESPDCPVPCSQEDLKSMIEGMYKTYSEGNIDDFSVELIEFNQGLQRTEFLPIESIKEMNFNEFLFDVLHDENLSPANIYDILRIIKFLINQEEYAPEIFGTAEAISFIFDELYNKLEQPGTAIELITDIMMKSEECFEAFQESEVIDQYIFFLQEKPEMTVKIAICEFFRVYFTNFEQDDPRYLVDVTSKLLEYMHNPKMILECTLNLLITLLDFEELREYIFLSLCSPVVFLNVYHETPWIVQRKIMILFLKLVNLGYGAIISPAFVSIFCSCLYSSKHETCIVEFYGVMSNIIYLNRKIICQVDQFNEMIDYIISNVENFSFKVRRSALDFLANVAIYGNPIVTVALTCLGIVDMYISFIENSEEDNDHQKFFQLLWHYIELYQYGIMPYQVIANERIKECFDALQEQNISESIDEQITQYSENIESYDTETGIPELPVFEPGTPISDVLNQIVEISEITENAGKYCAYYPIVFPVMNSDYSYEEEIPED